MSTAARLAMFSQVLGGSLAALAVFGFLWMNIPASGGLVPLSAAFSVVALAVARQKGDVILNILFRVHRFLPLWSPEMWLLWIVMLGLSLRLFAALLFPAILVSDSVRYLDLAQKLADGIDYAAPEGRAFWPPGLPLALAPFLRVFGSSAALAYNLGTFVLAEIATFLLGRILAGWRVGCSAAFLLAVWPNFIFAAPLLNKECLLIALWPAAVYFYLKAHEALSEKKGCIWALLAGAAVGYSALTQPSAAMLPVCFALFSVATNGWRRHTVICVLAVACGVATVVTPWAIRNYLALHSFEPIGTAGGENFFMVTRLESDGRWGALTLAEADALGADEVVRNKRGYALGIRSILDHPGHFLSTVSRKPFYLFGQDIKNVYFTFERGMAGNVGAYSILYWISNVFYLGIILLMLMFVMREQYAWEAMPALILPWLFTLYPIFAHSLFEASERHRYGALSFMAIFAAMALCRPANVSANRDEWDDPAAQPETSNNGARQGVWQHR
jgi:hypothetical protein